MKYNFAQYAASGVIVSVLLKVLLIPGYKSTDFEVHRNWLAITHSLKLDEWYSANHSQWTLDYPPLFAHFEHLLSYAPTLFDPELLDIRNLDYASYGTILFQRLTVILFDLFYAFACYMLCSSSSNIGLFFALLFCPALIMVDNIHFQYNGFLFAFQLGSIYCFSKKNYLIGGFIFAILLNFKHIYLYIAPVYFVFLLRSYCLEHKNYRIIRWTNLIKLGSIVVFVFLISFGPFYKNIPQVLKQLFPFKRGLTHAYWAPNFWAFYNFVDAVSGKALYGVTSNFTSGLVDDHSHVVFPQITPLVTLIFTVLSMGPPLKLLWLRPGNVTVFVESTVLVAYSSFLFGWHVHEKAILLIIIPFTYLSFISSSRKIDFITLVIPGTFSLFPLLHEPFELPIKVLLCLLYLIFLQYGLQAKLNGLRWYYLSGFLPLLIYTEGYAKIFQPGKFLPLMVTSVYCFAGVFWSWISLTGKSLASSRKVQ